MKSNYKKLGQFIRQVDVRNTEGKEDNLLGVSVQKMFIPSIANTVGTDFTKYKVVKRGQFTYIPDTSRRGDKIGIALLSDYDEGLVSNVYTVFEIVDNHELIPEFLMLWFSRPEFDRYARFKSHGSVREIFDWDEMCNVELPVPSFDEQKRIVDEYKAITGRIELKQKINDNLEQQILSVFAEKFSSIIKTGDNLPQNWIKDEAQNIFEITIGKTPPRERLECFTSNNSDMKWVSISDMGSNGMYILRTSECLTTSAVAEYNVKTIPANTVIYSFKMTNGRTAITTEECTTNEAIAHFKTDNINLTYYGYCYLSTFRFSDLGSTSSITEAVNSKIIKAMPFYIPPQEELNQFSEQVRPLFETIRLNSIELLSLNDVAANFLALLSR
ncbi:MAG: restriction endonuclease subunit S [Lachnospiraceae bacterium]|nr:restriction endonuclease subunit S [Lachnospiraceae bacterium]